MKRAPALADLSGNEEEAPRKKTFLEQVSDKIPKFKFIKKNKSPLEGSKSPSPSKEERSPKSRSPSPKKQSLTTKPSSVSISETSGSSKQQEPVFQTSESTKQHKEPVVETSESSKQQELNKDTNNAELARQHYNSLKQVAMHKRHESRIFNLRGFNNYVKSLTISDFLARLGALGEAGATILDLGCGKGGDLRKWGLAKPAHVVCVDIADVSVKQCRERYLERPNELTYQANFIVADCTRDNLDEKFKEEEIQDIEFDLVSCQFVLHYGFESQAQAKRMIRNAVSRLKPNCFFFGTVPNSNYLVKKYLSLKEGSRFGNDVYYVDFLEPGKTSFPLFGAKYVFYLDGSVEGLPEYLIHFPLLREILEEEGCECVLAEPFTEYIYTRPGGGERGADRGSGEQGSGPGSGERGPGERAGERGPGDRVLKDPVVVSRTRGLNEEGTLSQAEWEVVACYMVFGFRKLSEGERERRRDSKRRKTEAGVA